jgi:Bacterial membrane protein YfhO
LIIVETRLNVVRLTIPLMNSLLAKLDRQLDRWLAVGRRLPEWLWAALIFLGFAFLVFGRVILRPTLMVSGSDFLQFYFWEGFTRAELLAGRLPLWNPYFFAGYPAAANPQMLLFYPPAMLLRLLPISYAFGVSIWLHMSWAGLGMYYLVRQQKLSRPASLLSGLAFMMSGVFVAHVQGGHLEWLSTLAWLPWVVWRWQCLLFESGRNRIALAGLVTALMVLGGALRILACVGIMLGILGLFWLGVLVRQKDWRTLAVRVGQAALAVLMALGLSAPQILPALELAARSSRAVGLSLDCSTQFSLTLNDLAYLGLPNLPFQPFLELERIGYIGALGLLLALVGLSAVGARQWKWTLIAWAVAGLLLGLGPATPVYPLAHTLIPLLSLVRQPFTFIVLISFAGAGLAGLGLEACLVAPASRRWPIYLASLLLVLSLAADYWLYRASPTPTDTTLYARVSWLASFSAPRYLLALIFVWLLTQLPFKRLSASLAVLALLVDLWLFCYTRVPILTAISPAAQAAYVPALDPAVARIVTEPYMFSDQSMAVDVANAQGYAPIVVASYDDFVRGLRPAEACPSFEHASLDSSDDALLRQLSVAQVVQSKGDTRTISDPGPRAWWVGAAFPAASPAEAIEQARTPKFDPYRAVIIEGPANDGASPGAGTATITTYTPQAVTIQTQAAFQGYLVLNDVWYPGWEATVNGQPTPIYRANGTFRAVPVPAGQSTVQMTFHSTYLMLGFIICGLTILGLLAFYLIRAIRSTAPPAGPFALADS